MMVMLMIIVMENSQIYLTACLHPHANWSRLFSPCRSDLMSTFVKFWKPSHPQPLITPLSTNNRRRKIENKSICWPLHSLSVKHTPLIQLTLPSSHSAASLNLNRSADPCTVCHSGTSGRRPSTWRSETPGETNQNLKFTSYDVMKTITTKNIIIIMIIANMITANRNFHHQYNHQHHHNHHHHQHHYRKTCFERRYVYVRFGG